MKRLVSHFNLETVNSIAWGINNEEVALAKYAELGGVVEPTGNIK
jgi:hypothetical protein